MRELVLGTAFDKKSVNFTLAAVAFEEASKQKVKVYRTFIPDGLDNLFVLMTTSKEIHLGLGVLDNCGQFYLAHLFQEQMNDSSSSFVFFLSEETRRGILVSLQTVNEGEVVFHLSPAY